MNKLILKLLTMSALILSAFAFHPPMTQNSLKTASCQEEAKKKAPSEALLSSMKQDPVRPEKKEEVSRAESDTDNGAMVLNMRKFLKEKFGWDVAAENIHRMKGGHSGNEIYQIVDAKQKPILLIKAIAQGSGTFSKEFFAMEHFHQLKLKNLKFSEAMGIGGSQTENNKTFFLAMKFIDGSSIDKMLAELAHQPKGGQAREEQLRKLIHVFSKLGAGLAEFHLAAQTDPLPIHPFYLNHYEWSSREVFKQLENQVDDLFLKNLKEFFATRFAFVAKKLFARGYMHGDSHPGNYMYQESCDQVWMIDVVDGASSIGKNGSPLGMPFYDLARMQNSLERWKIIHGLTEEECSRITSAFLDAYAKEGGTLPSHETMEFFLLVDRFRALEEQKLEKEKNPKKGDKIFQATLAQLKQMVQIANPSSQLC